jgi:hypothetical protein
MINKIGILPFFLILLTLNLYCQSYDTIATKYFKEEFGEKINSIDSNFLKQGLWVIYDISSISHTDYGSSGKFDESISYKIKEFGHYTDNKKNGEWRYLYDFEKWSEFYYKDGSVFVLEDRYKGNLSNYYNKDSTFIISIVIDETYLDTFCIECIGKKQCVLYSGAVPLDVFDYSQFMLEIKEWEILTSGYRKLKKKMKNRDIW